MLGHFGFWQNSSVKLLGPELSIVKNCLSGCESVNLLFVGLLSFQHQDLSLGGLLLLEVCPLLGYQFVGIRLFIELTHNLYFCKIMLISMILFLILVI